MARYTFKSEENEYGYYNKVRFDSTGWKEVVNQFVIFLRGEGYVIGHSEVIKEINDVFNEYIEAESKPLGRIPSKSQEVICGSSEKYTFPDLSGETLEGLCISLLNAETKEGKKTVLHGSRVFSKEFLEQFPQMDLLYISRK